MKRILCFILAAIMLLSLCGCFGGNSEEAVRGEIVSGDDNAGEKEPEFSLGKATGNTYKNDFLGISCILPDEWLFYSDEQILQMNNIVSDVVDEEAAELLKNANIIYDMYAVRQTDNSNININLEKLSAVQLINLDIKQVLESQIDFIGSAYQNMGYTDINVVYEKITVAGREFDGLTITAKIQGFDFCAKCFTFRKSNYLANVTVCADRDSSVDAILGYFAVK